MHDREIEAALRRMREAKLPPCPANMESRVRRRIRAESRDEAHGWFSWNIIPSGAAIMAGVALFALGSAVITAFSASAYANQTERQAAASRALDFDFVKQTELVKFER